ncbi:hypothetical protein AeMF1_016963 [Aphanomyces euteiches]|nr:hypothetical protein AeMF1_016963 [Aphanomyces euteiches]KAH9188547.1 hypothetical protein AeNC1_009479 [Aphanomyces euteiches]
MVKASDPSPAFTAGLLLVRLAMVLMYVNVYFQLHETRKTLWIEILLSGSSSLVLLSSFFLPHFLTVPCYCLCFFIEVVFRYIWAFQGWFLDPNYPHIPMNIEHTSERYGCFVMVVLGEGIVSATINTTTEDKASFTPRYYAVMLLSFLVNFSMAMYYFAMVRLANTTPCVVGSLASTKLIAEAVLENEPLDSPRVWTLFGAISFSLAFMFGIRLAHFVGVQPHPSDPREIKQIKYHWWVLIAMSPLLPLLCAICLEYFSGDEVDPIDALLVASVFILVWVVVETGLMHWLVAIGRKHEKERKLLEQTPLISPKAKSIDNLQDLAI